MSVAGQSRGKILERVRKATQAVALAPSEVRMAYAGLPRGYIRRGRLSREARVALMVERLREYDAEVTECTPAELPDAIAAQLEASGRLNFVGPPETPVAWMVKAAWQVTALEWELDHWVTGHGLSAGQIEQAEGVVTGAFCGIADSGTIVLHHSDTEGRRVLTLLPDWHVCILYASQIVETLPEYFVRCERSPAPHPSNKDLSLGAPALATYISGPSATADIEMTRIKGVHGPRFLQVIVVDDLSAQQHLN